MIKLTEYGDQPYNEHKNLGFMRFDFADGSLANSFVAGPHFNDCSDKSDSSIRIK